MRKYNLPLLFLFILFSFNAFAEKITFQFCIKVSNEYNKQLPIVMNKFNTLMSTHCSNTRGGPTIHYI